MFRDSVTLWGKKVSVREIGLPFLSYSKLFHDQDNWKFNPH